MPIRINLKEIFPSDPQEINVEKVNFNFNKLLELGIGTPGPIGLTGPQGPAGPIGLTGPQGIRGATWWVDSDIPTTHTFTGLLDGDLYLDNLSFNVWRWDATTSTWTLEVGISTIIDTYLAANGSPFVKDLKDIPSLNKDTRFITFSKRDHPNDITRGIGSSSLNNSLFLTNFDEAEASQFTLPLIWPPNIKSLYNSIVSIFANHSDNQVSTAADIGRYHLELGSLYNDSLNTRISEVQHNLKIKFIKDYVEFPRTSIGSWNDWINTAQFSLSVDETRLVTDIDQNGIFNFITPKFNGTIPASLIQDELYTRVGPWEAHAEIHNLDYVKADGISFELFHSSLGSNIGIASDYVSSYSRLDTKDLFMLDSNVNVYGTLINDDTYIIGDTNVIGKVSIGDIDPTSDLTVSGNVSIGSGYNAIPAPTDGAIIEGNLGIGTSSPTSKLTVSGNASIGSGYDTILAPTGGAIIEGYVGINTSSPTINLDVNGSININGGLTNMSFRPSISAGTLTSGEIRAYSDTNIVSDDGFLRVSAGGGTNTNTKTYIDLSGFSATVPDMNKNIVFGTSGVETMRIDQYGRVGIGINSPTQKLEVTGSIYSNAGNNEGFKLNAGLAIHRLFGDGLGFLTANAERMRITASGRVGIGTGFPDKELTIDGSIKYSDGLYSFGSNTYSSGGIAYAFPSPDDPILRSGTCSYNNPSFGGAFYGTWTKVGSVVTVHGEFLQGAGGTSDVFLVPVQPTGSATVSHLYGVAVSLIGDSPLTITAGGGGFAKLTSGAIGTDRGWSVSFSYVLG